MQLVDLLLGELDLRPVGVQVVPGQQEVDLHVPGPEPDILGSTPVQRLVALVALVFALHGGVVEVVLFGPLVDVGHEGLGLHVGPSATLAGGLGVAQDAVLACSPGCLLVLLSKGRAGRSDVRVGVRSLGRGLVDGAWVFRIRGDARSRVPALRGGLLGIIISAKVKRLAKGSTSLHSVRGLEAACVSCGVVDAMGLEGVVLVFLRATVLGGIPLFFFAGTFAEHAVLWQSVGHQL